jgi:pentatricopeptide repeat protein
MHVLVYDQGKRVHEQINCEVDVLMGSSLVDIYAKRGYMEDALGVFNKMPSQDVVKCGLK